MIKRVAALSLIMALMFAACSPKGGRQSPEATGNTAETTKTPYEPKTTPMGRIYDALMENTLWAEFSDEVFAYNAESDFLRVGPADPNKQQPDEVAMDVVVSIINQFAKDEAANIEASRYSWLKRLNCSEISLLALDNNYLAELSEITTISTLEITDHRPVIPNIPKLKTLIVNDVGVFDIKENLSNCMNLENLVLVTDSDCLFLYIYKMPSMQSLKTISILDRDDKEEYCPIKNSTAVFLAAVKDLPSIETINGESAVSFDPLQDYWDGDMKGYYKAIEYEEHLMKEEEEDAKKEELTLAEGFLSDVYQKFVDGEYNEDGDMSVNGKAMTVVSRDITAYWYGVGNSSILATANGETYYGIYTPTSRFTADPQECTEVILVYGEHRLVGEYTGGGYGYSTTTYIRVIHLESKTVSKAYFIEENYPSYTKNVHGNGYGDFALEKAMEYVAELVKL